MGDEHPKQATRRTAIKTLGSLTAGALALGATAGSANADPDWCDDPPSDFGGSSPYGTYPDYSVCD